MSLLRSQNDWKPRSQPEAQFHSCSVSSKSFRRVLLELGCLIYSVGVHGQECAFLTQSDWERFANAVLLGTGTEEIDTARKLIEAIAHHEQTSSQADSEYLWRYCAAQVFRSIVIEAPALGIRWYPICRSIDVPEPYDYVTAQVFQEPILAIRLQSGISVFLNVCPHRQAQLLRGCGRLERGRIRCQYHSWTFSCDGNCVNIPGAHRIEFSPEFSLSHHALESFPCIEADGFVFVWLSHVPPSDTIVPSLEGLTDQPPVSMSIARLLEGVHPGYPKVEQPEIPAETRVLLRLGWIRSALERNLANISATRRLSFASLLQDAQTLPPEERNVIIRHLPELRQCLLDAGELPEDWWEFRNSVWLAFPSPTLIGSDCAPQPPKEVGPTRALPLWVYYDPELFILELERLIKPAWQFVGHEKEISEPGDSTYLDVAGERIYVFRSADSALFAGRLLRYRRDPLTSSSMERCLDPVDLDVWNGLIFVRVFHDGPRVADVWENPGLLEGYHLGDMKPLPGPGWYDFDVDANYKILWENFLELYHFPTVHKGMCRLFQIIPQSDLLPVRQSPSSRCRIDELDYLHSLRACAPHSEEFEAELRQKADAHKFLPRPLHFTMFGSIAEQNRAPITLGLTIFPDHIQAMSFVPLGPTRTRVKIRSYGHAVDVNTDSGKAMAAARQINVGSLQVELVEEDIMLNYLTQGGAASRLFSQQGVLGRMEISVQQFQQTLQRTIPESTRNPKPPGGLLPSDSGVTVSTSQTRQFRTLKAESVNSDQIPAFHELDNLETPAFLLDRDRLTEQTSKIERLCREAGCQFLYAMKALSFGDVLHAIAPRVAGFSTSSLFEARLARQVLGNNGAVHVTSPGLRQEEIAELSHLCDAMAFNSLSQWKRLKHLARDCSLGLRVNPHLSVVRDQRYDPCRRGSKLGVPIDQLAVELSNHSSLFEDIEGLHVHNACDINDFGQFYRTLLQLERQLSRTLRRLRWINLGGGYLFDNPVKLHCFFEGIYQLRANYGLDLYIEPGAAVVRSAGFLVATVIDLLDSDGIEVAVLDSTVSHVPEVFEYQFSPPVMGASRSGKYTYALAGSTCLAGDVFGTYGFDSELKIGSKVVFPDMGAYTLVKASMFNGLRLPSIYIFSRMNGLELKKNCTHRDFLWVNGETTDAAL